MSETKLRAYIAYAGHPEEGAALVFARTATEAKRLAWPVIQGWMDCDYIGLRVRWLRNGADWHRDPEAEAKGEPYVIEAPRVCERCEQWYEDGLDGTTGLCSGCFDDDESWEVA